MGIRTIVTVGVVALFAAQYATAEAVPQGSNERGRYEGIAASDNAVWVVDTKTGRVRKCTQEFADKAPACTAMSN
jgi:hypothetical protein